MLRGYRPSYRETLLRIRERLEVQCPSGLDTAVRLPFILLSHPCCHMKHLEACTSILCSQCRRACG